MTYFWVQHVAENRACAYEDEQHEVQKEDSKGRNLEHQAIVMIRKVVQEGRDYARPHDHSMPGPSEMSVRAYAVSTRKRLEKIGV